MITASVLPVSSRERRTVVIAVVVVGVTFLATRGIPAEVRGWRHYAAHLQELSYRVARARRDVVEEPVLRDSAAAAATRLLSIAPLLFTGSSGADATASLTSYVTGMAATSAVRITRLDAGRDSVAGLFRQLTLHVEAESDVVGLAAWLTQLEEGRQMVALSQLTISALEPGAAPGQVERLHIDAVLLGWSAVRTTPAKHS